jgi:predicted RNA-binding Zn-ribbon protein involved in translation (DUF1610 family)
MKMLHNVREVLKSLKHSKPTRIYCPRCCSPKITLHSSLDTWLTPKKYVCQNCGYTGSIIMELEKERENSENEKRPTQEAPDSTASSKSCNDSAP